MVKTNKTASNSNDDEKSQIFNFKKASKSVKNCNREMKRITVLK